MYNKPNGKSENECKGRCGLVFTHKIKLKNASLPWGKGICTGGVEIRFVVGKMVRDRVCWIYLPIGCGWRLVEGWCCLLFISRKVTVIVWIQQKQQQILICTLVASYSN